MASFREHPHPNSPGAIANRFAPGNKVGANNGGNRHADKAKTLRAELYRLTTREQFRAAAGKLIEMAIGGDLDAMKLWWGYVLGQPTQHVELGGGEGPTIILRGAAALLVADAGSSAAPTTGVVGAPPMIDHEGPASLAPLAPATTPAGVVGAGVVDVDPRWAEATAAMLAREREGAERRARALAKRDARRAGVVRGGVGGVDRPE